MDIWILKYKVEENEQKKKKKTMNGGRDSEWKKKEQYQKDETKTDGKWSSKKHWTRKRLQEESDRSKIESKIVKKAPSYSLL